MSRNKVIVVSEDNALIESSRSYFSSMGVSVQVYSPAQWNEHESAKYKGGSALAGGSSPVEKSNVLPFPTASNHSQADSKVATIDELESKAIENAIMQYRGNLTEAAKALGIGRATLYRKVKQYQIDPSSARKKRAA